jgi:hypothetical protein
LVAVNSPSELNEVICSFKKTQMSHNAFKNKLDIKYKKYHKKRHHSGKQEA